MPLDVPEDKSVVDGSLVFFGVLVCALAYLAVNPITLPCVGCDEGGLFYRCMPGTGLNSVTCEAWTKGSKGVRAVKEEIMTISEYSSELIKFSSHLPQYLYEFAGVMMRHIRDAAAEVYARLRDVAGIAKQKMLEVLSSLKAVALDTWATVYDKVIHPVMNALMQYVLQPITALLDKIVQFARMVIDGVTDVIGKAGDIMGKAYNAVYHAADVLSHSVEAVMQKSAQIIEKVVDGLRAGINKGLGEVVSAAEDTINTMSNAIGDAIDGLEGAVNVTIQGTTGSIEKGVNTIGAGITETIDGLEIGINRGLGGVRDAAQSAITGVTDGVESTVNTLGAGIASGLDSVLSETEDIVNDMGGMVEGTVNDVVALLNKGLLNPIESTINSSASIVENALAGIMVPVKSISGGLNKLSDVRINMGPIYDDRPFGFLKQVDTPAVPKIGKLDLKDIPNIKIPDVNVPAVRFVKPKGSLGGRQRLQAAVNKAQKNWQYALGHAVGGTHPYKASRDSDAAPLQSAAVKSGGVGLAVYARGAQEKRDYSFLPPMGNAQAAVSKMRQGTTPDPFVNRCSASAMAEVPPSSAHTPVGGFFGIVKNVTPPAVNAPKAPAFSITNPLGKTPPAPAVTVSTPTLTANIKQAKKQPSDDILIKGVSIPSVTVPKVPAVKIDKPNLSVSIGVPPLAIPRPNVNPVALKPPTVKLDVNLDSKVPQVPNIVQGISEGISALGELLSEFFKPVWSAFASLQGLIHSTIAMVIHFFREEVSWHKVVSGVTYALQRGWEGVKEVGRIVYKEVIVPMVSVMYFLRDKIVWVVREFASLAMQFLGDIYKALKELGHNLWEKVKPALRHAGIVSSGVAVYSLSQFLDRVPPFSMLPASATTKVYLLLGLVVMFLVGSQVRFMKDFALGFLKVALAPFMALDRAFDKYVKKHVAPESTVARAMGL